VKGIARMEAKVPRIVNLASRFCGIKVQSKRTGAFLRCAAHPICALCRESGN
jgi:hypothetical protein